MAKVSPPITSSSINRRNAFFEATLDEGSNEILIRVVNVGQGDVPMVVALQIPGAQGLVTLPTLLEPVTRRQKLAAVMGHAYLAQDVYAANSVSFCAGPTICADRRAERTLANAGWTHFWRSQMR